MFTKNVHLCLFNSILKRKIHGNESLINNCIEVRNRNPRNLERLLIARKPQGYHLEKQFRNFWHKYVIHVQKIKKRIMNKIYHRLGDRQERLVYTFLFKILNVYTD